MKDVIAKASNARFVGVQYLSKAGALLSLTLQASVNYINHLATCLAALMGMCARDFYHLVGGDCFTPIKKVDLTAYAVSLGIAVPKKISVSALVDLVNVESARLFTCRGSRAWAWSTVTQADIDEAFGELTLSLSNDSVRSGNYTQAETYRPMLDNAGEPIPGMKQHTLTGVSYVQGLVTRTIRIPLALEFAQLSNVYGQVVEAGTPKPRPLRSGKAIAKEAMRSAIGWNRWKTIRVDRCVYIAAEGHTLGRKHTL